MIKALIGRIAYPLLSISSFLLGIFINAAFFGGIVTLLPIRTSIIIVNVAPPYFMWIGIILLVSSSVKISQLSAYEISIPDGQKFKFNWKSLFWYFIAAFGSGMIVYYQFFASNLPWLWASDRSRKAWYPCSGQVFVVGCGRRPASPLFSPVVDWWGKQRRWQRIWVK